MEDRRQRTAQFVQQQQADALSDRERACQDEEVAREQAAMGRFKDEPACHESTDVRIFSLASEADSDCTNRLSKLRASDDDYDEDYDCGRWQHAPSSSGMMTNWKYKERAPPLRGMALINQKIEVLHQHPDRASPLSCQARDTTAVKTPGLIRLSMVTGPVLNPC